jgi:hypothetical protein
VESSTGTGAAGGNGYAAAASRPGCLYGKPHVKRGMEEQDEQARAAPRRLMAHHFPGGEVSI